MNMLQNTLDILNNSSGYIKSDNYYFQNHECSFENKTVRVTMNLKLKNELTNDIVLFGQCPNCKQIFYHEDFENSEN